MSLRCALLHRFGSLSLLAVSILFAGISAGAPPPKDSQQAQVPNNAPQTGEGAGDPAEKRKLGTELVWAESLTQAVKQAKEEQKLLFVIHISGNFEDPEFT